MGAYKQLLASDVIVSPLEVNKGFTFYSASQFIQSTVGIDRFLGTNITTSLFNLDSDPITGQIIIPGTTSSLTPFSILPFYNEAGGAIGSSSFSINNLNIVITGSPVLPNDFNNIYVPRIGTATNVANLVVENINNSSSNYLNLQNVSASNLSINITLYSQNIGSTSNLNYFTSASTTAYFSGGTNNTYLGSQYQRLVYHSIKELYYSNYASQSIYGSPSNGPVLVPGVDESGNMLLPSGSFPAYYNYLQTTLNYQVFYPTSSNINIGVISIPSKLFGDYIKPGSFRFTCESGSFYDDGEGNIISGSQYVGNIYYPHGIITLTGNLDIFSAANNTAAGGGVYASGIYASSVYGFSIVTNATINQWISNLTNAITSNNVTCSFSSSYTIYETQYKCTIRENEFNYTLNPSVITGSNNTSSLAGQVYGYVTSSDFSPYITTVGLYDEAQNLLAIGKLSQPIPSSPTTDTTILINIDR